MSESSKTIYFNIACIVTLLAFYFFQIAQGFNPQSLWLDDAWPAVLIKYFNFSNFYELKPSLPIGFVFTSSFFQKLISDPEIALQMLPICFAAFSIVIFFITVFKTTKSTPTALMGTTLLVINPIFYKYSLRIKAYTADCFFICLIFLAGYYLLSNPSKKKLLIYCLVSAIALLFSFTSPFLSVIFFHLALIKIYREKSISARVCTLSLASFNTFFLLTYYLLIRHQSNPCMKGYWAKYLAGSDSLTSILYFIQNSYTDTLVRPFPFPDVITNLLPKEIAGLMLLFFSLICCYRYSKYLCLTFIAFYSSLIIASILEIYPTGPIRISLFTFPMTIILASIGFKKLIAYHKLLAICTVGISIFLLLNMPSFSYPQSGFAAVITELEKKLSKEDGLVLYPFSTMPLAYYGNFPVKLISAPHYCTNFDAQIIREKTFTPLADSTDFRQNPNYGKQQTKDFLLQTNFKKAFYLACKHDKHYHQSLKQSFIEADYILDLKGHARHSELAIFIKK